MSDVFIIRSDQNSSAIHKNIRMGEKRRNLLIIAFQTFKQLLSQMVALVVVEAIAIAVELHMQRNDKSKRSCGKAFANNMVESVADQAECVQVLAGEEAEYFTEHIHR
jgi:hypothetical protein